MKIIHTADLHLGQVIYQNYDRADEHRHFFHQLAEWCKQEKPDALLVCGDVFVIQQPSAATKKAFTDYFVSLHQSCPAMHIIITAGNHDSASRIQADSAVWKLANAHLVGVAPSTDLQREGWQDDYIISLDSGYVIALPYMTGERKDTVQSLLDKVSEKNTDNKPVVMMGHLAVTGMDPTGHSFEIGKIKTLPTDAMGKGFDYLALGHIHKPQTIGHQDDCMKEKVTYQAGVIRYSGSALHVSCDEQFPHTVSVVDINHHGANVIITQLRIDELRHFHTLPLEGSYTDEKSALDGIKEFCETEGKGYIRLKIDYNVPLSSNFSQMVYDMLAPYNEEVRYNAKIIWNGSPAKSDGDEAKPTFEVAELQQMKNPVDFIEKTMDQYPGLDLDEVRSAFEEVKAEIRRKQDEDASKPKSKKKSESDIVTE